MGATTFFDLAVAKTVDEAYNEACRQARWESGHGGYTGTIAEKGGFVQIPRPPRVEAKTVLTMLQRAYAADDLHKHDPDWKKYCKSDPEANKAWRNLVKWYGEHYARKYVEQYDDKWGACIAVEASTAEFDLYKKRWRTEVKRGHRLFYFGGWASC